MHELATIISKWLVEEDSNWRVFGEAYPYIAIRPGSIYSKHYIHEDGVNIFGYGRCKLLASDPEFFNKLKEELK